MITFMRGHQEKQENITYYILKYRQLYIYGCDLWDVVRVDGDGSHRGFIPARFIRG